MDSQNAIKSDEIVGEIVGDDRFEIIAKAKKHLIEYTNISDPELSVLDNILFRCWQMGWLDQLSDSYEVYNEWEKFGKFRCSNCWLQIDSISTNTTKPMPIKFCPNCGHPIKNVS